MKDYSKVRAMKYKDAISCKLPNRRISIIKSDQHPGDICLELIIIDPTTDKPSTSHLYLKNKMRVTGIKLTREALDLIADLWIQERNDFFKVEDL